MTIKSIDMQVLVQKVGDVAKIQQAQQIGNHQQEEFVNNITKETDKFSKTVNKTGEGRHKKVDEKEEKERQSRKRYRNKKEAETDDKKTSDSGNGSNLDIIV